MVQNKNFSLKIKNNKTNQKLKTDKVTKLIIKKYKPIEYKSNEKLKKNVSKFLNF